MAFADEESVMSAVEILVADVWQSFLNINRLHPFPRLTYAEAISRYGSDKPDLRFGLQVCVSFYPSSQV
jgi:aspartyl-tRNA synthetase